MELQKNNSEKQQHRNPYDLLYSGINLKEEIGNTGIRLLIPRIYIHGRQNKNEYENKKRRQIETVLSKDGISFLIENPVILCAIDKANQMILTIIDGHHRYRYSGLYKISEIPCIVCTPKTITDIINAHNPDSHKLDENQFAASLIAEIGIAQDSFDQYFVSNKPIPIEGISNISQLSSRFNHF